jgi:hypothetical protein
MGPEASAGLLGASGLGLGAALRAGWVLGHPEPGAFGAVSRILRKRASQERRM